MGLDKTIFIHMFLFLKKILINSSEEVWGDAGYSLLNRLVQVFTHDYAGIFIVTSFIFSFFIVKAIVENSIDKCLSIYLIICSGYYFCSLNGIRQMIAASILLYAMKYVINRDKIKFIFYTLLASVIHLSALIFMPVYFIPCLKLKNLHRAIIPVITFVLARPLSSLITKILIPTKYGGILLLKVIKRNVKAL